GDLVPRKEKDRRKENHLCIKCGEAGHTIENCKKEWTYKDKGKAPVKGKAGEVKEGETEETKSTDSESEN
uniref:CCHC-type domain-containing protein n=1 Tax=Globodera pallida TaxID=36090 RepID=A0A183CQJ6_GLOPA